MGPRIKDKHIKTEHQSKNKGQDNQSKQTKQGGQKIERHETNKRNKRHRGHKPMSKTPQEK